MFEELLRYNMYSTVHCTRINYCIQVTEILIWVFYANFLKYIFHANKESWLYSLQSKHSAKMFKLLTRPEIDFKESIRPAYVARARIFKLLRSSRIDSKKPILPGCVQQPYSYSVPNPP